MLFTNTLIIYQLLNFIIKQLICSTFFIFLFFYFYTIYNKSNILKNQTPAITYSKFLLLLSLLISFLFFMVFIYTYLNYYRGLSSFYILNSKVVVYNYTKLFFELNIDLFSIVLFFLAYIVGFLSFLSLDNRFYWKNLKYYFILNLFIIIVFFFVFTNNIILFFFFYECLLVPSFFIVYKISPSRRAIQASLYFVIWTQIGSILVLLAIFSIINITGSLNLTIIKGFNFSVYEKFFISLLIFLGFGFKIPIWPLHYWLTKTHVEAPSGFSIYLSGFLVKSAIFGFYKLNLLLGEYTCNLYIIIAAIGVIDGSLKMWGQTDLKKLVAYATVQEMNLILLCLLLGDTISIIACILFCLMHAFLSTIMFYLVDCIQRRFNSRSVVEVSGIINIAPNLAIYIFFMILLFSGLPGTLKFTCEFFLFSSFLEISPSLMIVIMFIANVVGLLGFCKNWFNSIFGMFAKDFKYKPFDLNYKEFYLLNISIFMLIVISFIPVL